MFCRSPAKIPIPQNSATISSHPTPPDRKRQAVSDAAFEAALGQITDALANLNSSRFFINCPDRGPVYFSMKFDSDQFTKMVRDAFSVPRVGVSKKEMQSAIQAKINLDEQIVYLDHIFREIHDNGHHIVNARSSLGWLASRNQTYLEEIERASLTLLHCTSLPMPPKLAFPEYFDYLLTVSSLTWKPFPEDIDNVDPFRV